MNNSQLIKNKKENLINLIRNFFDKNVLKKSDNKNDDEILYVSKSSCRGCVTNQIFITNLCQNCTAKPCQFVCKMQAIESVNDVSIINQEKCKKCQMCIKVCPYNAIVKREAPCEKVCPVDAITKDKENKATINYDKCISCGKCIMSCPFGAINEKTQVIEVLQAIKNGKKVAGMFAPSIAGQFEGGIYQLKSAMLKAGFKYVYEIANGADITIKNEAQEFKERIKQGENFMTTSCCAGYNQLIKKHLPEIKPYVSNTRTPLYYTAELVKKEISDVITIFITPCTAKRVEVLENPNVDYVMSVEELESLFIVKNINVSECEETQYCIESSKQGRNFCTTGGVADSIKQIINDESSLKPLIINGINKETIKQLRQYAKNGYCENGCNLIEVMCCEGGCLGGCDNITPQKKSQKMINDLLEKSKDL